MQKWQNEHFTGSQADAPSKSNSKKTEINPVVICFTQLRGSYDNIAQAVQPLHLENLYLRPVTFHFIQSMLKEEMKEKGEIYKCI